MKMACRNCRRKFNPCPRVRNQLYCGRPKCRRAWKRKWQRRKRAEDIEYQDNQESAQKAWRKRHPEYWQEYRQRNPVSTEENRLKQRERNRAQRKLSNESIPRMIAKMDSINPANADSATITPGRYCMIPVVDGMIAKMDPIIVEISSISAVAKQIGLSDP